MNKTGKYIGKFAIVISSAVGLAEVVHRLKEAHTRKKAMEAAVRMNNKKATKKEES